MARYFFVMGYPYSDDENAEQRRLFAALRSNGDKAPVPLVVHLLETGRGRLLTVCEWSEDRMAEINEKGGLWGETSVLRQWISQAGAPVYQDADVVGPRTDGVEVIDGPSKVVSSFNAGSGLAPEREPARYDMAGPSVEAEFGVICPKCQARNLADRVVCSGCGAKLLPGRGILERIGYLVGGVVAAAVFVGLAWLFLQMEAAEALPGCCASPVTLVVVALGGLLGGIKLAFTRTPEYERYEKRAQRHVQAVPLQALADFTKALELAPEKAKEGILRQRGELYSKLGRKEEALADLSAYAASPRAHKGAKAISEVVGVEMEEFAGAFTEQTIQGLQTALVQEGTLKGVGYCKRCKDAVELDENRRCVLCGRRVKEPRFVKLHESDAELAKIREEAAARRKKRLIWLTVGGVAVVACTLCVGMGVWMRMRQGQEGAAATAAATATTFTENVFSFEYPSDWNRITEEEVDTLLETSLKGLEPGGYDYIGGVYTGGVGECRDCAQIVIVVAKDPSLTGTLTDEQYVQIKAAAEEQMGSRLISHRRTEVSSMPAVESVHIGASRQTKIWELIIVPPEPGVVYLFSCSSREGSYDGFEPVFQRAIETLRVGEEALEATPGTGPEPTADISGCTLGAVFQNDITVPDNTRIEAGHSFVKTWRIRNTGTCAWGPGYRLTFVDGDRMGGPDSVAVPQTPAGGSAEISVDLVAPAEPGQYRGYWRMRVNRSEWFGDKIYVQIVSSAASGTPAATPPPSSGALATFLADARRTQDDLVEIKVWFDRLAGGEQIPCDTVYAHAIHRPSSTAPEQIPDLTSTWNEYQAAIAEGQQCLQWLVDFCAAGGGTMDVGTFENRRSLSSSALSHCEHVVQALEAMQ